MENLVFFNLVNDKTSKALKINTINLLPSKKIGV